MNKYLHCLLASLLLIVPLRAADPVPAPATPPPAIKLEISDGGLLGETDAPAAAPTLAQKLPPAKALPFPQDDSDLKPDPAARFGTLPNGVRYVIMPNHEPKGRVSLRLVVRAGSLDESDDQRGLAHFLEHMAFNGSTHFPLDNSTNPPTPTLVEFLMRTGMRFGADTNANTGWNRTMYILELAHADDKTLSGGLQVFGDYAGGLLLQDDMIAKERGIILSEKRARDNVDYRTFVAEFESMLGDTLLPKRLPIGIPEVITTAPRERFVDFWDTWYRPERLSVVIVGDFADTDAVEKMVKTAFENLTPRAPAKPDPSLGKLPEFEGVRAIFHAEPEAAATDVSITSITPYQREPDTSALELKRLTRRLALDMLNRRFSILAKKEDAPFTSAEASVSETFNFFRDAGVSVSCKPDQWEAALAVGEQELRRALEHGFSDAELKEATANVANELEQAVKTASTRLSSGQNGLANELAESLVNGDVFTSPADDLALYKPELDKITPQDCLEAIRAAFASKARYVMVSGNVQIPGDASAAIAAAYDHSHTTAVAAPVEEKQAVWAYTGFGAPGKVVERKHIKDLDIELVTFANGVRLNIKKTNFEAGRISMNARIGGGVVTQPADQRGLSALAGATFDAGGLGKHSVDDLQRIFAGKNVGVQFHATTDAFTFSGGTTPDDLLLEMQILAAKITDPGYRPESMREAQKKFEQLYLSFEHTPDGPLAIEVANILASGDPRIGLPDKDSMMKRNLDEVKAWLTPQFAHGALEVALVGDLDVDAAIAAASKTIGALPARDPRPDLAALEKVAFPAKPFVKQYPIDSQIQKSELALYWPTDDGLDIKRRRRLAVLAAVFSDRLRVKVREGAGSTYSPTAISNASETFPGYGYIGASIDVDPAVAAKISDLTVATADDLATKGITDDELARVRLPLLTALNESLRSNSYWLNNVIARAQEKPEMLDWARNRIDDINSITTTELDKLAKEYLTRDHVSRVTILPAVSTAAVPEKNNIP